MQSAILKIMLRRLGVSVPSSSGGSSEEPVVLMQNYTLTNADNGKTFRQGTGDSLLVTFDATLTKGFKATFVDIPNPGMGESETGAITFSGAEDGLTNVYLPSGVQATTSTNGKVTLELLNDPTEDEGVAKFLLSGDFARNDDNFAPENMEGSFVLRSQHNGRYFANVSGAPLNVIVDGNTPRGLVAHFTQAEGASTITLVADEGGIVGTKAGFVPTTAGLNACMTVFNGYDYTYLAKGDLTEAGDI